MTLQSRYQKLIFAAAVVLVGGIILWAETSSWMKLKHLQRSFELLEGNSFHVGDRVEADIAELGAALNQFSTHPSAAAVDDCRARLEQLDRSVAVASGVVQTASESEVLNKIAGEVLRLRQSVLPALQQGSSKDKAGKEFEFKIEALNSYAKRLNDAQKEALKGFGVRSRETTSWLRLLFVLSSMLLVVLWIIVTIMVYRGAIAPMRARLKESQAIIERQEKLASLGTLAAGVAHEVRNPLTAMKVRLHSLRKTLAPNSSEQEDADVIAEQVQRLERIVRDFLTFARPSEPRFVMTPPAEALQRVQQLLAADLELRAIQLRLGDSVPDKIHIDPQQIEQVLINLVQNGADAIEQNGVITLRAVAEKALLRGRQQRAVVLEVQDTGKGIPAEIQKRLFDPFFTTRERGTGLGLSIAARIVEKHGGALRYDTALNRGTTFRIVLPAAR